MINFYRSYFGNIPNVESQLAGKRYLFVSLCAINPTMYKNTICVPQVIAKSALVDNLKASKITKKKFIDLYFKYLNATPKQHLLRVIYKDTKKYFGTEDISDVNIVFMEFHKEGEYSYRANFALYMKERLNIEVPEIAAEIKE